MSNKNNNDSTTDPNRRYSTRQFTLEQSTTLNNGARTVFIEHMVPGTSVPAHFHTRFSETFDLISGSMTVYKCSANLPNTCTADLAKLESSGNRAEIGKKLTVPAGVYHRYLVGDQPTVLRAIIEPGDADFERLLMVLSGLAEDGELQRLTDDPLLMAVVMGLADATLLGDAGDMIGELKKERGGEIERLREELLGKYDSEERLAKLMDG